MARWWCTASPTTRTPTTPPPPTSPHAAGACWSPGRAATGRCASHASTLLATLLLLAAATHPAAAQALRRVEEGQFKAGSGGITFSEVPLGSRNPVYPPARYGGTPDSPTVHFGGFFVGRCLSAPADCPPGATPTGCLSGAPTDPLTLDARAPQTQTMPHPTNDGYHLVPPALAGTPAGSGPIAILFDHDVAGVGLHAIGLNAPATVAISVYDRNGRMLGRLATRKGGVDFLGLATFDLSPRIAGLEFHLVGPEPRGFGVDNIRFGASQQIDLPGVAAPTPPAARRPVILP